MRLMVDLRYVGDPVGIEASLGISVLTCLAKDMRTPDDQERVQRMLFETEEGVRMLAALEDRLGLALVPVGFLH